MGFIRLPAVLSLSLARDAIVVWVVRSAVVVDTRS